MADDKVTAVVERDEYWEGPAGETAEHCPFTDTPHHEAMESVEHWQDKGLNDGFICEHMSLMKGSPYYKNFLERAKSPSTVECDPDWNIAWSHAEMIAVGILIGRREFGRREPSIYDIQLDLSCRAARPLYPTEEQM